MKKELSYFKKLEIISKVKKYFEEELERQLDLIKVQSPLFVKTDTGLQDDLSGVEKAVSFTKDHEKYEVVHSLAKWKRDALGRYGFRVHTGLYTSMEAIRKDEDVDLLHSLFVEQWDWEKVIAKEDRTIDYLKKTVRSIYDAILKTEKRISTRYPYLKLSLPDEITFITTQELEDLYPDKKPKEREYLIAKDKKAVFIIGIGHKLKSGIEHEKRSPDYDDWDLDGDLFIYDEVIDREVEISSMGIRVDEKSLEKQLKLAGCEEKLKYPYHQKILKKELPYTIGGGIGKSRVLLLFLQQEHLAEVQASTWPDDVELMLKDKKIL